MNEAILNHIEPLFFGAESFRRAMNWLKNLPKMEAISTPLIISWRSKFAPIVVRKRGSICWATSMKEDLSKLVYSHLRSTPHPSDQQANREWDQCWKSLFLIRDLILLTKHIFKKFTMKRTERPSFWANHWMGGNLRFSWSHGQPTKTWHIIPAPGEWRSHETHLSIPGHL